MYRKTWLGAILMLSLTAGGALAAPQGIVITEHDFQQVRAGAVPPLPAAITNKDLPRDEDYPQPVFGAPVQPVPSVVPARRVPAPRRPPAVQVAANIPEVATPRRVRQPRVRRAVRRYLRVPRRVANAPRPGTAPVIRPVSFQVPVAHR